MKKVLISILISILLISMFGVVSASSSSKVVLKASADKVKAGDTFIVDVTVNAEYDVTGISSLLTYDKTKIKLEKKEALNGFNEIGSGDELNAAILSLDGITLSKSVKIYTLTFKVLDNVQAGDINISLSNIELALVNNKKQINANADTTNIKLTVEGNTIVSNSNVSLKVNPDQVKVGDSFTVDVIANGEHNVTGISSLLTYDKTKLSLVKKEALNGFYDVPSGDELNAGVISLDGVTLSKSVKIYTLTFKVLENVSAGDIQILLSDIELALVNNNKEQIDVKAAGANAKITVIIEEPTPEDNTVVDKDENTKLPQTGAESFSLIAIFALGIVSVFFYKSYRKYNDI